MVAHADPDCLFVLGSTGLPRGLIPIASLYWGAQGCRGGAAQAKGGILALCTHCALLSD